jgi:hypothetical protein
MRRTARALSPIGGDLDDLAGGVAVDSAGSVVVTGGFSGSAIIGTVRLEAAGEDAFLAKFSAAGAAAWGRAFGGSGSDVGESITAGPGDRIFACGSFESTAIFGSHPLVSGGASDTYCAAVAP